MSCFDIQIFLGTSHRSDLISTRTLTCIDEDVAWGESFEKFKPKTPEGEKVVFLWKSIALEADEKCGCARPGLLSGSGNRGVIHCSANSGSIKN